MEFEIDIQHGLNGHIEITDYSKEYDLYYAEEVEGMADPNRFKYSLSNTINVVSKLESEEIQLKDITIDFHTSDKETLIFDVPQDGYYTVTHFVLPTLEWLEELANTVNSLILNYSTIYFTNLNKLYKCPVLAENLGGRNYKYSLGEVTEITVRELLERNVEGTTILKCLIDIFYTGYLLECYINHCRELFQNLMKPCPSNCKVKEVDYFPRDFLWMSLNVIDYLIERGQYLEALRILEEINYCGGFCNNVKNNEKSVCGCHSHEPRPSCGCH